MTQRDRQREYEELIRRYEQAVSIVMQAKIEVETEKARLEEYRAELVRLGVPDIQTARTTVEQMRQQYDEMVAEVARRLDGFETAVSNQPAEPPQTAGPVSVDELLMEGSR